MSQISSKWSHSYFQPILVAIFVMIAMVSQMKKVNKQCLIDTPRTVRVSEKTWQVIVRTRRP